MNCCELIKKIAADPFKSMNDQLGRPFKVGDMLELEKHVADCVGCQDTIDSTNEKYPQKPEFYKGELN